MDIECKVSISRRSDNVICIAVEDATSHVRFLELEMTLEAFAMAITGHGYMDAAGEVHGLEVVGKRRIAEDRQAIYPGSYIDKRDAMSAWLEANCQEDGWILDTYLGSQGSVASIPGGGVKLNYRVVRFAD
jgi:hypothetical protein